MRASTEDTLGTKLGRKNKTFENWHESKFLESSIYKGFVRLPKPSFNIYIQIYTFLLPHFEIGMEHCYREVEIGSVLLTFILLEKYNCSLWSNVHVWKF